MIEFKDIEIKYGNFVAVKELNLRIEAGQFFTLLGPSGCGKSTILRSLAGFVSPSKGSIRVDNKDITNVPVEKREIGMVFQNYALFPTMNVYENIAFGMRAKKFPKEEIDRRVTEIARKVDLNESHLYRNVAELSGGQQQRVALARAVVLEPKILCLDEPLSNLDAKLRVGLRGELKKLQRDLGITTLYVTHDQEEALTLSDRIAVFNKGVLEQEGTPDEIYNKSASEFVCEFVGDINNLGKNIIKEINRQSNGKLDENKKAFLRTERVFSKKRDNCAVIKGTVTDVDYNGFYTKYTYDVLGEKIKNIEINDGCELREIGREVELYINVENIMQF